MVEKADIFSLAKSCLNLAERNSNLKSAEVFYGMNKYINIEIEENSIKHSEISNDAGISIRVIDKRGSLGFSFTNKIEKKSVTRMAQTALKMMDVGTPDSDFKDLPRRYDNYSHINGLFDKELKNLQLEDTIGIVSKLIKVCKEDDLAITQSANFLANYSKRHIFNTNGLEISDKETIYSTSSNIVVKDKVSKETSFGYEWETGRNLKMLDTELLAKNALEQAKRNLNRIKIKSCKVPLILTPNGAISLLLSPIASAINAETFQYKRSFLVGKRNEQIAPEILIIEDNPLIDDGAGSAKFDGEGVPCNKKQIIDKGEFLKTGLLHNSYTAGKEGIESTGNAARPSYTAIPSIGISNFIMRPGDFSTEETLNVKDGILLDYTGDSPNIATGDFSGLILHGNLIKNGEIKEPLNETMIGINLFDLFNKIDAISEECKIYGSYQAPYVRISEVQVIGAAE